jgi:putative nucleotidyltransferase with HDIG domain
VRFATQLKFEIHEKTLEAIIETNERLNIISQERVTAEFNNILLAEKPSYGLELLKKTGILKIIFPELDLLEGIDQRQDFHHKDVFYHTLQVVDNIAEKTDKLELRLTALLHDIAKPETKRFIEGTGWTFHGHEEVGAGMADRICRRMRYPLNTIKYLKKLVRLHLRPMQLVDENVTDSALRRLAYESGDALDDLLTLCRADITSKNPEKVRLYLQNFDRVERRIKEVAEKDKLRAFQPVLTGNDIMKILNIPPGPKVGELKRNIVDAILDGKIPNEYQACYNYLMEMKEKNIFGQE